MMWKRRGKSDRDGWSFSGRVVRSLPCQRRCPSVWKNAWLAKEEKMMHAAISGRSSVSWEEKEARIRFVRPYPGLLLWPNKCQVRLSLIASKETSRNIATIFAC